MSVKQVFNTSAELDLPNVLPTLDLDFANSKTLDPRITFTRASGGSYVGADGLIKYAGVNEPRFDHDPSTGESLGLLVEESRTNKVGSGGYQWILPAGDGVRFNQEQDTLDVVAPDGTNKAAKFYVDGTETDPTGSIYVYAGYTSYTNTNVHTSSVWIKPELETRFRLTAHNQYASNTDGGINTSIDFEFDLSTSTGKVTYIESGGIDATVIPYPNGWYRCSITYYRNSTNPATSNYGVIVSPTTYYRAIEGSGTLFYLWGAQVEEGIFPTSFIPNTGIYKTRQPDSAIIIGKNFSDFYNPIKAESDGITLFVESRVPNPSLNWFRRLVSINYNNDGQYRIEMEYSGSIQRARTQTPETGQVVLANTQYVHPTKDFASVRAAFGVKYYSTALATNGGLVYSYSPQFTYSYPFSDVDRLYVGASTSGFESGRTNGCISSLKFWNQRLTNNQLITLTE